MRGTLLKILTCLLVVSGVAMDVAAAAQRAQTRKMRGARPGQDKAYSLEDIMKAPKEYLERDEVYFYARYATTANLFKPTNTRFNSTAHVNFVVWPDKLTLWETKNRLNALPTLYVPKNMPELLPIIRDLNKYELIAITGKVLNVYGGYPWITVTKIERIEQPSDRLCEQVIEHMQNGHDALKADHGGAAARHFEQALQFGLPFEFRAKAYEQLAQAYLLDNKLDRARGYLRQAVELNRADPILHLALADVALRMGDAGEALAHCQFALERSGRYPQVYGIKGEAQSLLGDFGKAFADLNTAAGTPGITPREKAMVSVRRARIYTRADRYPDAARVYAAVSEPGEPLGGEAWLHNEIGLFYERLYLESDDARYLDSAYAAFEEASRISRLDPALIYNMAEVEFRRQRLAETPEFNKVSDLIQKVYEVEPDYPAARILEGRVLFIDGKIEEAEYRYQSVANQIGSDPTALLALAEAYMDLGYYDEAASTVSRARKLEPWNCRVQALGQFLEETASQMAIAESKAYDDWRLDNLRERRYYYGDRSGGSQGYADENCDEYYYDEQPAAPRAQPESRPQYEPEAEDEPGEVRQAWGPRGRKTRPVRGATRQERALPQEDPRERRQARPERKAPPSAHDLAARPDNADAYRFDARKMVRPNPASGMGVSSSGLIEHGSARRYPQDIQASVRPSLPERRMSPRFPRTEVRLPERQQPRIRPGQDEKFDDPRDAQPQNDERDSRQSVVRPKVAVEPLDLGYTPGNDRLLDTGEGSQSGDSRGYEEEFGKDYEWGKSKGREAELDDDGFLRFGMTRSAGNAYASMPITALDEDLDIEADAARIPQAFSFKSDDSPLIIADVRSPGPGDREVPVRNANVYRRFAGGRQPAEIIEKGSIADRLPSDTSVMAPPKGGAVRRAEVKLPSSSRGVGMASDYAPNR